jgi:ABC-2 type transport system ATP-binding protein
MIQTNRLTKQLGGQTVVSDVTFRCEPGTVTGFLGPNGAGKTTTMRMLVGLSEPDSGRAQILGGRYRDLPNPGRRVGILLDASAQHAGRRGREALAVSAHTMGVPAQRVDTLLELVGLDETAGRRRVGKYSLGMRQRLGLAHALLGDPEVLILDEPANGLDPEGMRWMHGLLRNFADRGGTVLLSSHLLAEVEAIADRMMIISGGRIQAQGTRAELLTESKTLVEADDLAALDAALHRARHGHPPRRRRPAAGRGRARGRSPRGDGRRRRAAPARPSRGRRPRTPLLRADHARRKPTVTADRFDPSRAGRSHRMSTTTLSAPIPVNTAGVHARPGLGRLVAVELRKMVDTRAGFWLQGATVALTMVVVVVRLLVGDAAHHTFQSVLDVGLQPAAILLPILGILLVTSEWSQRTGLITFALVPVRSRVLGAKLIASLLLAVAMLAISVAVVAAGVLVASPGVEGTWSDAAPLIGQSAVNLTAGMVVGVALGAILLTPTPAIVLHFALPTSLWAVLSLPVFSDVAPWVDYARNLGQMTEHVMSATQWAHAGTSLAICMVLPLLIGARRITQREIAS